MRNINSSILSWKSPVILYYFNVTFLEAKIIKPLLVKKEPDLLSPQLVGHWPTEHNSVTNL